MCTRAVSGNRSTKNAARPYPARACECPPARAPNQAMSSGKPRRALTWAAVALAPSRTRPASGQKGLLPLQGPTVLCCTAYTACSTKLWSAYGLHSCREGQGIALLACHSHADHLHAPGAQDCPLSCTAALTPPGFCWICLAVLAFDRLPAGSTRAAFSLPCCVILFAQPSADLSHSLL